MSTTRLALAGLLLSIAACGSGDPKHQSSDKMNELQPTLEEQQSAAPDPIHLSYSKLLRAADNLQSCQRDGDPRVIAVLNQRKGAEELAMARQLGLKMVLAERIVRFKMQSELHVRCYPDFESALREMSQAVKNFRNLIERLPAQGS